MSNNSKNSKVMKASKKNNQATEVKVEVAPQPLTERQSLRALCKQLRAKYGTEERINNLLLTRFPAWGKPVSRVNKETGEQYTFFPVTHFYVPEAVCQA